METRKTLVPETVGRAEAADILGVAHQTLAVWASKKRYGLPYVKVGRCVRYRIADLHAFLERNLHGNVNVEGV
jgi:excisionase family DNA binding protein